MPIFYLMLVDLNRVQCSNQFNVMPRVVIQIIINMQ